MDHKLENLKADFKRSIPTSFTEQDKQAVMQKIKKPKLDRGPSFLPKTLSFIAFAVACLFFIVFIFSSDSDLFNLSREDSAYNSNEETAAMNGNDAADDVNEPDIIGYVMEVEENQILVVASEPITTAGSNEFYDAMYFSNVQEDVQVGDFVQAWTDGGAADSYPGQAALGHLEVIEVEQREGAKLTEAEAIQRAIDYGKETNQIANHVIAIRSIDFDRYNQENAVWSFEFYDTMEENAFHIEIQDQHPNEVTLSPYDTYLNPIMSAPFDPETIETDEVIGSFTVTDVSRNADNTTLTLVTLPNRPEPLKGDLIKGDEWRFRMKNIHFESIGLFPFAESDFGERVQFQLVGNEAIQTLYANNDENMFENVEIDIEKIEYEISQTGTMITLYL